MIDIKTRLRDLNIMLPEAPPPAANYIPYVKSGSQIFFAGQTPVSLEDKILTGRLGEALDSETGQTPVGLEDKILTGRLGEALDSETGQLAARYCGLRLIAQMKAACVEIDAIIEVYEG